MRKMEVVKEWLKRTEEEVSKMKKETEIDYRFRSEFGFSPDKIEWRDGQPYALTKIREDGKEITFSITEIFSGKRSNWELREYTNCFYWEKRDGSYIFSISISKDGGIELLD